MIVGIGVDLADISRFQRILRRSPAQRSQVFSLDEQAVAESHPQRLAQYGAAFAVKEAVFKALGQGWLESALFWTDIELLSPFDAPAPRVRLGGDARATFLARKGTSVFASTTVHDGLMLAVVILSGEEQ